MDVQKKIQMLKSIDILSFLHEATLERLAEESREIRLKSGETLFHEGEEGKTMFIVLDGEIRVFKKDLEITVMGQGSVFGEMALIESEPRAASVQALESALLMEINQEQFQRYFASQPQVLMSLMKTMSSRFRRTLGNPSTSLSDLEEDKDFLKKLNEENESVLLLNANTLGLHKGTSRMMKEFGFTQKIIEEMTLSDLLFPLEEQALKTLINPILNKRRSQAITETELRKPSGETVPVEVKIRAAPSDNGVPMVLAWISDISGKKEMENTVRQMAYYDSLTGLPNRNLLNDRLAVSLARAKRNNEKLGIMFLDLDNFKTVNDTMGHETGDLLLNTVGKMLQGSLRQQDTVARMGGDEFIIIAPEIKSSDDAGTLAQKIINKFDGPIQVNGQDLFVGCSIGISTFPEDGNDTKTLLKNADLALYRAKDRGKNNFQMYTPALNFQAMERMAIEKNLHKAVDRDELDLLFQPKVELESGKIIGVEGLVRWNSHELGQVMPDAFIPVAEDTRIIFQIGLWTLNRACQQIREWRENGLPPISISINLSGIQFAHPQFIREIQGTLNHYDVSAELIQLEITEAILMRDMDLAIQILQQLGHLGIKVAIDDFGTGYSSLNHLKNLPIHYLKIDKIFVGDFSQPTNAAIAKTIIGLGQSLGLKIIAEGIESAQQKDSLLELGCDEGQGYLFSPPVTGKKIQDLLRKEKLI